MDGSLSIHIHIKTKNVWVPQLNLKLELAVVQDALCISFSRHPRDFSQGETTRSIQLNSFQCTRKATLATLHCSVQLLETSDIDTICVNDK